MLLTDYIMMIFLFALLLLTSLVSAHLPGQPVHQLYSEGDFVLENGIVIKSFNLSFTTNGTLNADKSNAILMVTAIGGNHHRLDYLIGPGLALDTNKYFVICTDAIGNGLTTSPSNSKLQPNIEFPEFNIRDMVNSQQHLVVNHFGIKKLFAVVGASMGGMQALQWGVSYPKAMRAIVPIVPLAKTHAWTTGVLEMLRQCIMSDSAYMGGKYTEPVEKGMRLFAGWLNGVIVRTPEYQNYMYSSQEEISFLKTSEDGGWKKNDPNDWIWQSRAYDRHDVGQTNGFNSTVAALKSVKAKTLILAATHDLLNPEADALSTAKLIPGAKYVAINDKLPMGHYSASGKTAAENAIQNKVIAEFFATLKHKD